MSDHTNQAVTTSHDNRDHVTRGAVTTSRTSRSKAIEIQWVEKYPDLMPGKMFFECERLSASITRETCHQNWTEAHGKRTEDRPLRLDKCLGCPAGHQLHATVKAQESWFDVRKDTECVRCGRRDLRIIVGGGVCVSCWNRERECRIGKNARGRMPQTMIILSPRRVGLVIDGRPAWRRFDAYHEGEAISRAIRQVDGAQFHSEQPAKAVWNARVKRWQYRCSKHPGEFGTLHEHQSVDGTIQYVCPVCTPKRARGFPEARVEQATSIQPRGFVAELVEAEGYSLKDGWWTPTTHVCDRCQHYTIQVRRIGKRIEAMCPMCDA